MLGRRSAQKLVEDRGLVSANGQRRLKDNPKSSCRKERILKKAQSKKVAPRSKGQSQSPEQDDDQNGNYNLRAKSRRSYLDFGSDLGADDNDQDFGMRRSSQREKKDVELHIDETIEYDRLPKNSEALNNLTLRVDSFIQQQRNQWFKEQLQLPTLISSVPESSVPINADVLTFDWKKLAKEQLKHTGQLFDGIPLIQLVIMMDPPWQLSTSQPSRGVAIAYSSIKDDLLTTLPIPQLQKEGFIFIWAINAKYRTAVRMIEDWGYKLVDEIIWVKRTVNGKIAKGHGFYLQHAKENCLVGYKGTKKLNYNLASDIIWSERRGQSQKPQEIYELIERLVPQGRYLEIFGRRNNLRGDWVTIGNEI